MSTLQQTLALLQGGVDTESERLRAMMGAPTNRKFVNPGQGAMESLRNPDGNQARAMLAASLEMMGHDPTTMPGQTFNKAITRGMGELDQGRGMEREQGIHTQALALRQAEQQREMGMKLATEKPTAAIQEYQYAVDQGYTGSFDQFIKDRKGGINVNMPAQVGTIPPGYGVTYDEQGRPVSMMPVPGGPADRDIQAEQAQQEASNRNQASVAGFTLRDARHVQENIDGLPDSAAMRLLQARVPGSASYEVQSAIKSLQGTIAIEQLLAIKREGSGLGQVPQSQLMMLASLMGELDIGLSKDRMKTLLSDIQGRYVEILDLIPAEERAMIGIADREYNTLKDLWSGDGSGEVDTSFVDEFDLSDAEKDLLREALKGAN